MTIAPIDLFASFVRLGPGGRAHAEPMAFDPEQDQWQLMTFHAETDAEAHADHWEIHSEADEVVACLSGGMRLYLRPEQSGEEEEEVGLPAGTAVVVPRGRWHRLELDAPSDMMSLTVPRGSRLERRAEAQA